MQCFSMNHTKKYLKQWNIPNLEAEEAFRTEFASFRGRHLAKVANLMEVDVPSRFQADPRSSKGNHALSYTPFDTIFNSLQKSIIQF